MGTLVIGFRRVDCDKNLNTNHNNSRDGISNGNGNYTSEDYWE